MQCQRTLLGTALVVLTIWVGSLLLHAADPPKKGTPPDPEKKYSFNMNGKPWSSVFDLLKDITGKPVITTRMPTGSFTVKLPGDKKYSIPEIIDIINEGLLSHESTQRYYLLNRGNSFTLISAAEKVDPALIPRVSLEDLKKRGRTEIVRVLIPLKSQEAEDLAPEIKKLMGPFGDVVALTVANQLDLQDTVGNLQRVTDLLAKIEGDGKGKSGSFTHKCEYITARRAYGILKQLLGDPLDILRTAPRYDRRQGPPPGVKLPKLRMHYISYDEKLNTVMVTGPADKIALAKSIVERIDEGDQKVVGGEPVLKSYRVEDGTAETIAKTLQEAYADSKVTRIAAANTTTIVVLATPHDQMKIALDIMGNDRKTNTRSYSAGALDATTVAEKLTTLFGDPTKGAPTITSQEDRNTIVVRGTEDQLLSVEAALKAMGGPGSSGGLGDNMRVISLDGADASVLAEALKRMLKGMDVDNPVEIEVLTPGSRPTPSRRRERPAPPTEPAPPPMKPARERPVRPGLGKGKSGVHTLVEYKVAFQPGTPTKPAPKSKKKPIRIIASGNQLLIVSDDPKALAIVNAMVRMMTRKTDGKGAFKVIRLKYANATEAAKALDEVFNGTSQTTRRAATSAIFSRFNRGGFGSRSSSPSGGSGTTPTTPRIRVVAYPPNNSLLVQANPIDMLTIESLLKDAIDKEDPDSDALSRPHIIVLKYARATEVAELVKEVYKDNFNASANGTSSSSRSRSSRFARLLGTNNETQPIPLSVSADDRTNRLVVNCPRPMAQDIEEMCQKLDDAAKTTNRVVRVIPLKGGIDPMLLQQAINAIQGRATTTNGATTTPSLNGGFAPRGSTFPSRSFPSRGSSGTRGSGSRGNGSSSSGSRFRGSSSGGRSSRSSGGGRGRRFFVERVTDDPKNVSQASQNSRHPEKGVPGLIFPFYDPQKDPRSLDDMLQGKSAGPPSERLSLRHQDSRCVRKDSRYARNKPEGAAKAEVGSSVSLPKSGIRQVSYQPPRPGTPMPPPMPVLPSGDPIRGPEGPVDVQALERLGALLLSGKPEDVEATLAIIEYLIRIGAVGDLGIETVRLQYSDPTAVTAKLTELYRQVVVGPGSNTRAAPPTRVRGPQGQETVQQQLASVVMIPLPRQQAIIVAAPRIRIDEVITQIKELDKPTAVTARAVPFQLKRAQASRVAVLISDFYAQRYPNEPPEQNQVRVTFDEVTNTVFVQAAPADLEEIKALIEHVDTSISSAVHDIRIVPLRYVLADQMAQILLQAITQTLQPGAAQTGLGGLQAGGIGGFQGRTGGVGFGQQGRQGLQVPGGQLGRQTTQGGISGGVGTAQATGMRGTTLRFVSPRPGIGPVEAGLFADVTITPYQPTNSLILTAPEKTMELLLKLIDALDVPPSADSGIKVFTLKRADATTIATILQQLFLGSQQQQTTQQGVGPGVTPGGAATGQVQPLQLSLAGPPSEGAPLISIRITVDPRSNSIVVAGSENDLLVAEALIARLDIEPVALRRNDVYHLQNSTAVDVANALNNFFQGNLEVLGRGQIATPFLDLQREVVVVPEPITNKLLISATERAYPEIIRLIHELDAELPQVVIQVLIAEVDLNGSEEFGVEFGLQSPVLFERGVFPAPGLFGSGSTSFANNSAQPGTPVGFPVTPGVTVNTTINPAANPGFNFLNPNIALGNNPAVSPNLIGVQGLGSLGVGRVSSSSGLGGFVFSAASESFNLLIRALKTQGRVDILSRPQIMALDNQIASLNVGQSVPVLLGTTVVAGGLSQQNVTYVPVGIGLTVVPKITPDGRVIMRVQPTVSSISPNTVQLGVGVSQPIFNQQIVDTTVIAADGETVAIGGLITRQDGKTENKIPWLGDLPGVGALFRFRTQTKTKQELLVILTPRIVRTRAEADRILAEEAHRIDWIVGDVIKTQGPTGMAPIFPPPPPGVPAARHPKGGHMLHPPMPGHPPAVSTPLPQPGNQDEGKTGVDGGEGNVPEGSEKTTQSNPSELLPEPARTPTRSNPGKPNGPHPLPSLESEHQGKAWPPRGKGPGGSTPQHPTSSPESHTISPPPILTPPLPPEKLTQPSLVPGPGVGPTLRTQTWPRQVQPRETPPGGKTIQVPPANNQKPVVQPQAQPLRSSSAPSRSTSTFRNLTPEVQIISVHGEQPRKNLRLGNRTATIPLYPRRR